MWVRFAGELIAGSRRIVERRRSGLRRYQTGNFVGCHGETTI
jgi:hypothetical protein